MPATGLLWLAGLFAITGSPPFGTFASEFTMLKEAFAQGKAVLAVVALAALAIAFAGMSKAFLGMSLGRAPEDVPAEREAAPAVWPALALLAVLVALAGVYVATIWRPQFLTSSARASHAKFMASGLELVTPPGPGPFPTVLLIHGCGGLRGPYEPNPIMDEYAASAVKAGWAAAILDSYAPRDWEARWARIRVCSGLRLRGFHRAADVLAGLDVLQDDPRVDTRHLRIASWSHGGWAVGDLVTLRDPGDGSSVSRFTPRL